MSRLTILVLAAALCAIPPASVAQSAPADDPVLVENGLVKIRRSDYERELEKLPPDIRPGFATSERRVNDLLRRMLIETTLAAQARGDKLPEKPEYAPRIADEINKLYAQLKIIDVERAAEAEFESRRPAFEARAKELYTVDRAKYTTPEQISASHILFETKSRSKEAAEKLALDARAKLAAGVDFNKLALEISEDGSAKRNSGRLGWFGFQEMDPAFAKAAFALKTPGELSAPVLSSFGWHLIRLDDRRPARPMTFEEARDPIMAELKAKHVGERREAFVQGVRNDPTIRAHREAIDALVLRVDTDEIRRQVQQVAPGAMAPPAK